MKKALLLSALAIAATFGATGQAHAYGYPCRGFERTVFQYGTAIYQSGTECLTPYGNWQTVSLDNNYYPPAAPVYPVYPVQYVETRPVYTSPISLSFGFLDINRHGGGGRGDWHHDNGWHGGHGGGRHH